MLQDYKIIVKVKNSQRYFDHQGRPPAQQIWPQSYKIQDFILWGRKIKQWKAPNFKRVGEKEVAVSSRKIPGSKIYR